MSEQRPRAQIVPLGDSAILCTLGEEICPEVNDAVMAITGAIQKAAIPGIIETQPAYSSLAVHYDRTRVSRAYAAALAKHFCSKPLLRLPASNRKVVEIPVVYGGDHGPDLDRACEYLGITQHELVRRHCSPTYRVYMIGFTPGFPYLGGMDPSISLPRLQEPRKRVPAGSVGIAGNQTGVYPQETPGGWRIIGRATTPLFDPTRPDPSLLNPGDSVRFVPVSGPACHTQDAPSTEDRCLESPYPPVFEVVEPGFLTIVVDEGRPGLRRLGVPVSGAADLLSFRTANMICGNDATAAALEITLLGPALRVLYDTTVVVTGGRAQVTVDGREVPMDRPLGVQQGSVVSVGSVVSGCRCYLTCAGGLEVPTVLGSKSTYLKAGFGGHFGRTLRKGDLLPGGPAPTVRLASRSSEPHLLESYRSHIERLVEPETVLRVIPGPEATPRALEALLQGSYTIRPESDRMGLRLQGKEIPDCGDILSSVVIPGTIQVPSDGHPVILLSDAQTTGGYTRIACAVSEDLPLAGQLRPGSNVSFKKV